MDEIRFEELYDVAFDLMNLQSVDDAVFLCTATLAGGVNVDFDINHRPFAVELINPSKMLKMRPEALYDADLDISLEVSSTIHLRIDVAASSKLKVSRFIDIEAPNGWGLSDGEYLIEIVCKGM